MESAINKENVILMMEDNEGTVEKRTVAGILVGLVEIREAIQEGFETLERSQGAGLMMVVEYKETLDSFLQRRLGSEEVLDNMAEELSRLQSETEKMDEVLKTLGDGFDSGKGPEKDGPPAEGKKNGVTLDEGNFGLIPSGSGKT